MRILAISDVEEPALSEYLNPERWKGRIDLVVSCGDLSAGYLEYLVDVLGLPVLYVHGNHDEAYHAHPPGGCESIGGRVRVVEGLRFLGLDGSADYNGGVFQYSERDVRWTLLKLRLKRSFTAGLDVVVAHAPPLICPDAYRLCSKPAGVGARCPYHRTEADGPQVCPESIDIAHRAFGAYRDFVLKYQPILFLHGHRHLTYARGQRIQRLGATTVVNAYGHVLLEIGPDRTVTVGERKTSDAS